MGYHRAGFDVVGVDKYPQKNYPFPFIQGDAIKILKWMLKGWLFQASDGNWYGIDDFDAIHASPPCQRYSEQTQPAYRDNHPDLISPTRNALSATGKPFVIENVEAARALLLNPVMLCGSMFGLKIWRHRYFEVNPFWLMSPMSCRHDFKPILITGMGSTPKRNGKRYKSPITEKRDAIKIDWMTTEEISEAIPPAYTEFIGRQLLEHVQPRKER